MFKKISLVALLSLICVLPTLAQVTATHEMGDYNPGDTLQCYFTTYAYATGAPTSLAGTPVVKVYKDGDATSEVTTGLTLNVDFDSRTGSNEIDIVASDAFYAAGHRYTIIITTGTVSAVSVVGFTPCTFTLQAAALTNTGSTTRSTMKLAQLDVTNSAGTAVIFKSTGSNGKGLTITGNGSGGGLTIDAGATGNAATITAGATSGLGLVISSTGTGTSALKLSAQGTGSGLYIASTGAYPAVDIEGDADAGVVIASATSAGLEVDAGTNSDAILLVPNGTGVGIRGSSLAVQRAAAYSNFTFKLVRSSDNKTPSTGKSPAVTLSKDGAAFGAAAGAATEMTNGWYKVNFTATEMTANEIVIRITEASSNTVEFKLHTNP